MGKSQLVSSFYIPLASFGNFGMEIAVTNSLVHWNLLDQFIHGQIDIGKGYKGKKAC